MFPDHRRHFRKRQVLFLIRNQHPPANGTLSLQQPRTNRPSCCSHYSFLLCRLLPPPSPPTPPYPHYHPLRHQTTPLFGWDGFSLGCAPVCIFQAAFHKSSKTTNGAQYKVSQLPCSCLPHAVISPIHSAFSPILTVPTKV